VGLNDYQIPITIHVIYKLDTSYHPAENTLVFTWPSPYCKQVKKGLPWNWRRHNNYF